MQNRHGKGKLCMVIIGCDYVTESLTRYFKRAFEVNPDIVKWKFRKLVALAQTFSAWSDSFVGKLSRYEHISLFVDTSFANRIAVSRWHMSLPRQSGQHLKSRVKILVCDFVHMEE